VFKHLTEGGLQLKVGCVARLFATGKSGHIGEKGKEEKRDKRGIRKGNAHTEDRWNTNK
jgi:hypothetical protein